MSTPLYREPSDGRGRVSSLRLAVLQPGNRESCLRPRSVSPTHDRCIPWYSKHPEAQHPRRSDWREQDPEGCFRARTPQTSGWTGEGEAAGCPRREGPRGGGELQRGAPGSVQALLSVPRAEAPSLEWAGCWGEGRPRRWWGGRGGGAEGKGRGNEHCGGWERLEGWRARGRAREKRLELPEKARRKKRRKETHPAPNTRVSPVTNRKVLPQEEVIGAVESRRSREPKRQRERERRERRASERTRREPAREKADGQTDRQRAQEGG